MPLFRNKKSNAIYDVPDDQMDTFASEVINGGDDVEPAEIFVTRAGDRFLVGESKQAGWLKKLGGVGVREAEFDTNRGEWFSRDKDPVTGLDTVSDTDIGVARLTDLNAWKGFTDSQAAEAANKVSLKDRVSGLIPTKEGFAAESHPSIGIPTGGRTEPLDRTVPTRDSLGVEAEAPRANGPSLFFDQNTELQRRGGPAEDTIPTRKLLGVKDKSKLKSIGSGTMAGLAGLNEMIPMGMAMAYDAAAWPQNRIAALTDNPQLATSYEAIKDKPWNLVRFFDDAADDMMNVSRELSQTADFDKGIVEKFVAGDVSGGVEHATLAAMEQIPQIVAVIAATAVGNPAAGLAMLSGSAAGQKFQEIKGQENLSASQKYLSAASTGAWEFITEKLTTVKFIGDIFKTKAAKGAVKKGVLNALGKVFKPVVGEGGGEGLNQLAQNTTDIVMGITDENGKLPGMWDGVPDSALLGTMMGGGMSVAGSASTAIQGLEQRAGEELGRRSQEEADVMAQINADRAANGLPPVEGTQQPPVGDGGDLPPIDTPEAPDPVSEQPAPSKAVTAEKATPAAQTKQVVYHGTPIKGLTELDPKMAVEVDGVTVFSSDKDVAEQYMFEREYGETVGEEEGSLIEAVLDIKNPMEVDFEGRVGDVMDVSPLIKEAKSKGHDGLIIRNIDDSVDSSGLVADSYFVFDKSQIKTPSQPKQEAAPVTPEVTEPKAKKAAEPKATPDDNSVKLDHATTAIVRESLGIEPHEKIPKETEVLIAQAKSEGQIEKATDNADAIGNKSKAFLSDAEHVGMVIKVGQVENEIDALIESIDSDIDAGKDVETKKAELAGKQELVTKLIRASDRSGSEVGSALQARKIRISREEFTQANLERRIKASKGKPLNKKDTADVKRLEKKVGSLTKQIKKLRDELNNQGSTGAANAEVARRSTKAKRERATVIAEQVDIKAELRKMGTRVLDVTGTVPNSIKRARLIQRLAFSYVDLGIHDLREVKKRLDADLPDTSSANIYDAISGHTQRLETKALNETEKVKRELQREARLSKKIEDGYNKIFDNKKTPTPTSNEVRRLKELLVRLRRSYENTEFNEDVFSEKVRKIETMQAELDGLYRDIRPAKQKTHILIKQAESKVKNLVDKMSKIDELADLAEQIRTGKFKVPAELENSRSPELDALSAQILFMKQRIARITSGKVAAGKSDAAVIEDLQTSLSKVKDQIDKGYRELPLPKKARSKRVAEVRQELKEMLDLRGVNDRISEMQRRIDERDFALTPKEITTIKSEELAKARIEMMQVQREARALEFRVRKKTAFEKIGNVASLPRSMLATLDMSYALRQALIPSVAHPKIAGKAFGKAFAAFWSQNKADAVALDLENHPMRKEFDKYGIYFSSMDQNLSAREEYFASNIAEKIPVFGRAVLASERNMVTGLNLLRAGLMTDFLLKNPQLSADVLGPKKKATLKEIEALEKTRDDSVAKRKEYDDKLKELTELERQEVAKHAYARYVNIATGRGDLGGLVGAAETLSHVFFAPRFAVSRVQVPFTAIMQSIKHPELMREIGKQWAYLLGVGMSVLWLGHMAGASVGLDPDDSDWGKFVVGGNKHIDIWGGTVQSMRIIAKAVNAPFQTARGEKADFEWRDVGNFFKYKLNPIISLVSEQALQKDLIGRKLEDVNVETPIGDFNLPWRALSIMSKFVPLTIQSAVEAYHEGESALTIGGLTLFEGVGGSAGVYDDNTSKKIKRPKRR